MLRSKSRSRALDVGAKHHRSIVSRTLSSSKICREDPLIDKNALVSIDRRPSAAKIISASENQLVRVSTMQRQMGRIEEELKLTKNQLDAAEHDRDRALDELQESKLMEHEANSRLTEALSPGRSGKVLAELTTVKELLSDSQKDLAAKEKYIESIKLELDKAKQLENKLADKLSSLGRLEDELRIARVSETRAMDLCAESRKRVAELEAELKELKQSKSDVLGSEASLTKEFEAAKIELEESKRQLVSLHDQLQKLQSSSGVSSREQNGIKLSDGIDGKSEPGQKSATSMVVAPQSEIEVLKKQLKAAIEGEEQSTKAMNDLALALKEVATECNYAKEKLISTESELDKYRKLLDEEKKEAELHRNTADRLRLEAEESYLAWNGKEKGFVDVIKQVEEEKVRAQQENVKLKESLEKAENTLKEAENSLHEAENTLHEAENTSRTAREENEKLRDVLKQAINEANVAKEAASIAQQENSELKDSLVDKEKTIDFLARENDQLKFDEAAASERIKELERLLSEAQSEAKTEDKDSGIAFMSPESLFDDHKEDYNKREDYSKKEATALKKGFSFDLHRIKLHNKYQDEDDMLGEEDPIKADALRGSIFDPSTRTPRSEAHTPKQASKHHHHHLPHHRKKSSLSNIDTVHLEDLDHLDVDSQHDSEGTSEESEADRQAHRKKKSVALKNFGYLLMRKSFTQHTGHTKKESSILSPDHE
ncbi:hypothetical protein DCAR_0518993 [Daucus carota subsp. sativus]|uniref:WEB family protein n=1 Tax=Daucus carota subsp. sativus TaxID=79200 RepID=A0AAF0X4M5_DAUCS|nr:PREDICTED: putative WEB family protein At1g65010, chloroplastic [Daucus carota subsp. sativus]WOG99640.1 hypothetical protein DCAR_0518993 [Daucus carota subsp. sativus]